MPWRRSRGESVPGCLAAILAGCVASTAVLANQSDDPVPPAYRAIAADEGVPAEILFVIALKESGVRLDSGRVLPWPWTLNIGGESRRYDSRVLAHAGLLAALADGQWVDVGLGQVSWQYHKQRLRDPWTALDPLSNLRIAAALLRDAYETGGDRDWWTAVGRYHAPGRRPEQRLRARRYAEDAQLRYRQLFGNRTDMAPAEEAQ